MSAPLVVNTADGACWTRRAVTSDGVALYALADVCSCPEFVMATFEELAARGIVGSAFVVPAPVGPEPEPQGPALPWAHVMAPADLHLFLDDLVAAAITRWQTDEDGNGVEDRVTLTLVEQACARWRTPGRGPRSDEEEMDPVEELIGANLSLFEEEQLTARLRLAWESAKRDRRALRARVAALEAERTARQNEVSAAVGYTPGFKWPDLVRLVSSNTASLVQAERDVRALRAQVAELETAEKRRANTLARCRADALEQAEHEPDPAKQTMWQALAEAQHAQKSETGDAS